MLRETNKTVKPVMWYSPVHWQQGLVYGGLLFSSTLLLDLSQPMNVTLAGWQCAMRQSCSSLPQAAGPARYVVRIPTVPLAASRRSPAYLSSHITATHCLPRTLILTVEGGDVIRRGTDAQQCDSASQELSTIYAPRVSRTDHKKPATPLLSIKDYIKIRPEAEHTLISTTHKSYKHTTHDYQKSKITVFIKVCQTALLQTFWVKAAFEGLCYKMSTAQIMMMSTQKAFDAKKTVF